MYEYNAQIVKVVDGDTFDFNVDLGFKIKKEIRVRLKDFDAPETRGVEKEEGKRIKAVCENIFASASSVIIKTHKTGKYGRWLADVYINGVDIKELIK